LLKIPTALNAKNRGLTFNILKMTIGSLKIFKNLGIGIAELVAL